MIRGNMYIHVIFIISLFIAIIQPVSAIYINNSVTTSTTDYNRLAHIILNAVKNYLFVNTSRYNVDYIELWCNDCTFYGKYGVTYEARLVRDDKISFVVRFDYLKTLREIVEIDLESLPPVDDMESVTVTIDRMNKTAFIDLSDVAKRIIKILDVIRSRSLSKDYDKLYSLFTRNTSLLKNINWVLLNQTKNSSLHNTIPINRDYLLFVSVNNPIDKPNIISSINVIIQKKFYLNAKDYATHNILKIFLKPLFMQGNTGNDTYFIKAVRYIPLKIIIKPGKYPPITSFIEEANSYAEKLIRREGYDPANCSYKLFIKAPIVYKREVINETILEVRIIYVYLYRTPCSFGLLAVDVDPLTGNISGEFLKHYSNIHRNDKKRAAITDNPLFYIIAAIIAVTTAISTVYFIKWRKK